MEVIRRANDHGVRLRVLEHFFDVVVGVLDVEPRGERLRFGEIVVADGDELDAVELSQDRQVRYLGDRPRADHGDADGRRGGIAHRPANRYIRPPRKLTVDSWLATTPRASSVNRKLDPVANSAAMVALRPASTPPMASATNVPSIAFPLPFRTCTPIPTPRYVV